MAVDVFVALLSGVALQKGTVDLSLDYEDRDWGIWLRHILEKLPDARLRLVHEGNLPPISAAQYCAR